MIEKMFAKRLSELRMLKNVSAQTCCKCAHR